MHKKVAEASERNGNSVKEALLKKSLERYRKRLIEEAALFVSGDTTTDISKISLEEKKEAMSKVAIRGGLKEDPKTGEKSIILDFDGEGVLALINEAGLETDNLIRIEGSEKDDLIGRVIIETRKVDPLGVKNENGSLHINPNGDMDNSCTKSSYEILVNLGLMKRDNKMKKFVDCVTRVNNKDYNPKEIWKGKDRDKTVEAFCRSLYGLQYNMSMEDILDIFKNGGDPDNLDNATLAKYSAKYKGKEESLGKISNEKIKEMKKLMEVFEQMEKDGLIFDSGNEDFGKFAVDVAKKENGKIKKIPQGSDAAKLYGCDSFMSWSPEENSFMLRTKNPIKIDFPQGHLALPNMWMKERNDGEMLKVTLNEILGIITNGKLEPKGELKKILEGEIIRMQMLENLEKKFGIIGTEYDAKGGRKGEVRRIKITKYGYDAEKSKGMVFYRDMEDGNDYEKDEERFERYINVVSEEEKAEDKIEEMEDEFKIQNEKLNRLLNSFEKKASSESKEFIDVLKKEMEEAELVLDIEEKIEAFKNITKKLVTHNDIEVGNIVDNFEEKPSDEGEDVVLENIEETKKESREKLEELEGFKQKAVKFFKETYEAIKKDSDCEIYKESEIIEILRITGEANLRKWLNEYSEFNRDGADESSRKIISDIINNKNYA